MSDSVYQFWLKKQYYDDVVLVLQKEFLIENLMVVLCFDKVVFNMGLGEVSCNIKIFENVVEEFVVIIGQCLVVMCVKKLIVVFKLCDGMFIGCCVILCCDNMWYFFDCFIVVVLLCV